jgi:hypothetical protein
MTEPPAREAVTRAARGVFPGPAPQPDEVAKAILEGGL